MKLQKKIKNAGLKFEVCIFYLLVVVVQDTYECFD